MLAAMAYFINLVWYPQLYNAMSMKGNFAFSASHLGKVVA